MLLVVSLAGCGEAPLGLGIGLPPFAERPAQGIAGLVISRAFVPPAGSTNTPFVELYNGSGQSLDLGHHPMTLESPSGSIALGSGLWASGSVLQVVGGTLNELQLHAQAGELVLLDSNLVVSAYGAWGNDPNETLGSFALLAQSSNQSAPWRELPYPLADNQAIALDSGRPSVTCADANLNAAYPPAALSCASGPLPMVWLSRVVPQGLDAFGSAIELYNASASFVDIWGLKLCRATGCQILYPHAQQNDDAMASILAPASTLPLGAADAARRRIVFVDGLAQSENDLLTTLNPIRTSEELALVAPGGALGPAMSYVRLQPQGNAPSSPLLGPPMVTSAMAAAWQTGLAPPRIADEALALEVAAAGAPNNPNAWRLSALGFGTSLSLPTAPWDACSAPQNPALPSVVIDQVVPWDDAGTTLVGLTNIAPASFISSNASLSFGAQSIALGTMSLAPNTTMWVALTPQSDCSALGVEVDLCASGQVSPLSAQEFALINGAQLLSFVQWGSMPFGQHAAQAVAAGAWPTPTCAAAETPSYNQVQRLVRLSGAPAQSPADFVAARLLSQP